MLTLRALPLLVFMLPLTAAATGSQFSLSYEPAILHASVLPGGQYQGEVKLYNQGETPIRIHAHAYDFLPENDYGGVKLLEPAVSPSLDDPVASAGWVKLPDGDLVIAPGRALKIPYVVSVPAEASPGARDLAIVFDEVGAQVGTRLESLLFLDVPGSVLTDMTVDDFSIDSFFNADASGVFTLRVTNTGKTHVRPIGEIVIRNMFGRERGRFPLEDADSVGVIPPGAHRTIEYGWNGGRVGDFGLWFARVELSEGDIRANDVSAFFVLPWRAILIAFLAIGGPLVLLRFSLARMRRVLTVEEESRGPNFTHLVPVVLAALMLFISILYELLALVQAGDAGTLTRAALGV